MNRFALATLPNARTASYGTQARLTVAGGGVEAYLAFAGSDRRAGTASYALRVANNSENPLRARMMCARLRGKNVLAYPLDVQVAPFSISETLLPVRVAETGPFDRAIVHVSGGDVAFSLEAPGPPKRVASKNWTKAGVAAVLCTLASAFLAATATPRLNFLAAPALAFAASPSAASSIDVPYAYGGWANLHYSLQTRDGRQLAAGLSDQHEGTLHFSVPASAGSELQLAVNIAGPFGATTAIRRIGMLPQKRAARAIVRANSAPAQISELAVKSPVVRAGETVHVTYATNAREGNLWLIDDTGRLWAQGPISAAGAGDLKVPLAAAGRQMRVVLHARSANSNAVSSVAVVIAPAQQANPATSATVAVGVPALELSTLHAAPGEEFTVTVTGAHGDARISLTDASGNVAEVGDVPAGQTTVALTAPYVQTAASYFVVANISQGAGEQTILRRLTVTPR